MCGIAGLLLKEPSDDTRPVLAEMARRLAHRGPDGQGFLQWSETTGIHSGTAAAAVPQCRAALAHRRLSIFDPTPASAQPMSTADGRLHLVFNGAIYNYVELRGELESLGHQFRSRGDTEVLLAALAEWGPAALSHLVGMFALALLDTTRRVLLLARDPLGIKPLYFAQTPAGLAFASEQHSLLAVADVDRRPNPQRLYDYLRFGLTDHGAATMVRGIAQVEPAIWIEIPWDDPSSLTVHEYWRADLTQHSQLSFEDAAERLRALFLDNIRLHLRSDVPLGAALSGGIDSSAIVAAMRNVAGPDLALHAFCYVADDKKLSEEHFARLAAERSGATLHAVRIDPQQLAADLDRLIDSQGEPFGSTSIFAQRQVFAAAREQGLKVILDGQGADELLGGYRYFIACRAASLLRRGRWWQATQLLRSAAKLPASGQAPAVSWHALGLLLPLRLRGPALRAIGQPLVPDWLDGDWFAQRGVRLQPPEQARGPSYLREQLWLSVRETSLPALLRYEDRNSMAFGLESRVPLLTTAMAEFVFALPEDFILGADGTSKRLFRRALSGLVPDEILNRRDKIGFATPEQSWLKALTPMIEETLQGPTARALAPLRPDAMWRDWQAQREGKSRFDFRFWRWVNLIRWVQRQGIVVE